MVGVGQGRCMWDWTTTTRILNAHGLLYKIQALPTPKLQPPHNVSATLREFQGHAVIIIVLRSSMTRRYCLTVGGQFCE